MASGVTTVTTRGQLTIPIEIRRALGIEAGDRLAVEQKDDTVVLRRAESISARTAGSLAEFKRTPALTPREEREEFERAVAEEQAEFRSEDTKES